MPSFARRFKQQDIADCELQIYVSYKKETDAADEGSPAAKRARTASNPHLLSAFPAHQIILRESDYFEAQHWQNTSSSNSGSASNLPAFKLTIDNAEQLPAAEAVIAMMYGIRNALTELSHVQLVHALLIADMVNAAEVAAQAERLLKAAAATALGLSESALTVLAGLNAWPMCLHKMLPLILARASCCSGNSTDLEAIKTADTNGRTQRMLLAVFGKLHSVCREHHLQKLLLKLPLPAMQLLLSPDQLHVPSEDTVLYTAQQYVAAQKESKKAAARAALSALVRAPHLSQFALYCMVLSTNSHLLFMGGYQQQLRALLSLKHFASGSKLAAAVPKIAAVPHSWTLETRCLSAELDAVEVIWDVPISDLATACRSSYAKKTREVLGGPTTPPLACVAWQLSIGCQHKEQGTVVGLFATPRVLPAGVFIQYDFAIECNGNGKHACSECVMSDCSGWGWPNFFCLQPMTAGGGWDEAAWAAAGLPTSGKLTTELRVENFKANADTQGVEVAINIDN